MTSHELTERIGRAVVRALEEDPDTDLQAFIGHCFQAPLDPRAVSLLRKIGAAAVVEFKIIENEERR